ncbi:MAG: TetR/AcrR family transcriptional regulator [Blautia sp.]|nr:TetR/AcrR family transcriptional regulator [Blautia sp.]
MGKVDNNKKQKETTLYNAAYELFSQKGLTKTTISDIVNAAGVAKGTFYLYFHDKYDLHEKLVAQKVTGMVINAFQALSRKDLNNFEDTVFFLIDHIISQLEADHVLLNFVYHNLSWSTFTQTILDDSMRQLDIPTQLDTFLLQSNIHFEHPEFMFFTIIELIEGTAYNCIYYQQPAAMEAYRPYLHKAILGIISQFQIS